MFIFEKKNRSALGDKFEYIKVLILGFHWFIQDDGLMVMCAICKFWQHGVCFLIVEEEDAPDHHVCDVCAQVTIFYTYTILNT